MLELNISTIFLTIVNLLVLYFLLKIFLFNRVTAIIESRQKEIENNMTAAEDQRIKAESMLEEYGDKLTQAGYEAEQLVAQAKTRGEQEYQAILKAAQIDANKLTEDTEAQLESERIAMLAGVRKEVATLALMAAAKVSSMELNQEEDQALVESFLAEAGERK